MNNPVWFPYVFIFILLAIVAWRIENAVYPFSGPDDKIQPLFYSGMITIMLIVLAVFAVFLPSVYAGKLAAFIPLLVIAVVYYALLYRIMPALRRKISSVGCAYMWIVPCALTFNLYAALTGNRPLLWIRIGHKASRILLIVLVVYLAVALFFFIREIVSHIRYRKKVMSAAQSLSGTFAFSVLESEAAKLRNFRSYVPDLMVSSEVDVPVAIGFFRKSKVIILPTEDYEHDDLRIILRHELIHIARGDCMAKLDMALVSALFWPIPWVRRTSERCAEDMELSCDELVLAGSSDKERQDYARLILSRPAESKGFSSCLSASAESLKYRLQRIMSPEQKRSGAIIVCLALLITMLLFRSVGLSVYAGNGSDLVFRQVPQGTTVNWGISYYRGETVGNLVTITDPEKFNEYIAGLELDHASWDRPEDSADKLLQLEYGVTGHNIRLILKGDRLTVSGAGAGSTGIYRVPGGIDWDYIESLIVNKP